MDTPIFNIHDVILIMTFAVSSALALMQPVVPDSNRLAKGVLAIFYLCIATDAVCTLLLWNDQIHHSELTSYLIAYLFVLASLIKGAALYFYILVITRENVSLQLTDGLHLLPVSLCLLVLMGLGVNTDVLRFELDEISPAFERAIHGIWYFIKIIPVVYAVAALLGLRWYRQQLRERYSSISEVPIDWLNYLVIGFLFSWVWTLAANILGNLSSLSTAEVVGLANNYINFFLAIALFAYSISYVKNLIRAGVDIQPAEMLDKTSELLLEKIRSGIELQKLYLNQSLTIEEFSKEIAAPYREVSDTINRHFNTNFFEFINKHRVEEAKRMLSDPAYDSLSILEILHESGFNSKSAFQRFFKRLTGESPRAFRKNRGT
jgi:AraC-like DNA-binding protein